MSEVTTTVKQLFDGSSVEITFDAAGLYIETRRNRHGQVVSRERRARRYRGEPKRRGLEHGPPAVRTNPIPGESDRVRYDPALGREFHSASEREAYMRERGLEDVRAGDVPQPISEASLPIRPPGMTTHGMVKRIQFEGDTLRVTGPPGFITGPDGRPTLAAAVPLDQVSGKNNGNDWLGSPKQKQRIEELQRQRKKRKAP